MIITQSFYLDKILGSDPAIAISGPIVPSLKRILMSLMYKLPMLKFIIYIIFAMKYIEYALLNIVIFNNSNQFDLIIFYSFIPNSSDLILL